MTLDSESSTPDPPDTGQVIDSDDEMEREVKPLEEYYKANIKHNHPNFHMTQKAVKEELRSLRASINLFNKSNLPYSSINYLFIAKEAES